MPIISWPTSQKQIRAFEAGLSQLARLRPIPGNPTIRPHPLPVFNMNIRELVASGDTGAAETLASWRYFATGDSDAAALAGDIDLSLHPRLIGLSYGPQVLEVLKVEKEGPPKVPDMDVRPYEPRLFRVPGLFVEAFWLKALAPPTAGQETGWVVPYHTLLLDAAERYRPLPMHEFLKTLSQFAEEALAKKRPQRQAV
jgi:hypothetical protein